MISMLLMCVFSHSLAGLPPQVFVEDGSATLFGRQQARPTIDAVASTGRAKALDARAIKAQEYFAALDSAVPFNRTAATTDVGRFTISGFTQRAGLVLMKFWEKVATGVETVLSCVIDLASVGKKAADITDAKQVQADWLDYFWKLWSCKEETFKAANPHRISVSDAEERKITEFMKIGSGEFGPFTQMRSFVPRWYNGQTVNSDSSEKVDERNRIVKVLANIPDTVNIANIVNQFAIKVWGIKDTETKGILDPTGTLETAKPRTREEFEDNNVPSKLKQDFWQVIWDDTILKIKERNLSKEAADSLLKESLLKLEEIAEAYRTAL